MLWLKGLQQRPLYTGNISQSCETTFLYEFIMSEMEGSIKQFHKQNCLRRFLIILKKYLDLQKHLKLGSWLHYHHTKTPRPGSKGKPFSINGWGMRVKRWAAAYPILPATKYPAAYSIQILKTIPEKLKSFLQRVQPCWWRRLSEVSLFKEALKGRLVIPAHEMEGKWWVQGQPQLHSKMEVILRYMYDILPETYYNKNCTCFSNIPLNNSIKILSWNKMLQDLFLSRSYHFCHHYWILLPVNSKHYANKLYKNILFRLPSEQAIIPKAPLITH